ncbi:MAG: ATP-binding cassette domain-containing protein [Candidatus Neomarinimicrobiota bacterium]|jgi:iron complex transport system ATP-binding protein
MQDTPILDFKNIHAHYGTEPVLENVNLKIKSGQHWAILGANGSGKSSLIKLISNELYPDPYYFYKKELFGQENWHIFDLKSYFGIITNDLHNYFYHHAKAIPVNEAILSGFYSSVGVFPHQLFSDQQLNKVREVLEILEISHLEQRRIGELSTGELRRVVVGRALIHDPQAFILDEPTVGLDIKAQDQFIHTMRKLSKHSTIILITHHLEEIFPEISHIALMYNKSIFQQGKKADILTSENLSKVFDMPIDLKNENGRYYLKSRATR